MKPIESIVGTFGVNESPKISKLAWPTANLPARLVNTKFALIGDNEQKFTVMQGGCPSKFVITASCPEPQCGWSVKKYSPTPIGQHDHRRKREGHAPEGFQGKIVGGSTSSAGDWPFLVGIFRNGSFHCCGTIISSKWILTAAHCFHTYQLYVYEIQAGMLRRFSWSPYEQTRQVLEVFVHEGYDSTIFKNDIALLKLENELSLSKWISPACLASPDKSHDPKPKQECTVIGWGNLAESTQGPDHLQQVSLPVIESCAETFASNNEQICAGLPQGGKDACQGDSGGPFVCKNSEGRNMICGVVSFGKGCARPMNPGVYTRVSYFRHWIDSVILGGNKVKTQVKPLYCPHEKCIRSGGECLFPKYRCNRKLECFDGMDEKNCEYKDEPSAIADDDLPLSERAYSEVERAAHGNLEHTHDYGKAKLCGPTEFQCKSTKSCIPVELICNGAKDCSDMTDEMGCECSTIISKKYPDKKCDGFHNCPDGRDELNCNYCNTTNSETTICPISKKCVATAAWCDGKINCLPYGEDEVDCVRIAKSPTKVLSPGFLSDKHVRGAQTGYVFIRKAGLDWSPLCAEEEGMNESTDEKLCNYLGYSNHGKKQKQKRNSEGLTLHHQPNINEDAEIIHLPAEKSCATVKKISCGEQECGERKLFSFSQVEPSYESFGANPWWMLLLVDGKVVCSGTLIHKDWVLVSKKCVLDSGAIRSLSYQYITIMSGYSEQSQLISSPLEQIRRVNSIDLENFGNLTLLHLQSSFQLDHLAGPICTQIPGTLRRDDFRKATCVRIKFNQGDLYSEKVNIIQTNAGNALNLAVNERQNCKKFEDSTIYCQLGSGRKWFYMGYIDQVEFPNYCSFISLYNPFFGESSTKINGIMSKVPSNIYSAPDCAGTRCPLGNCVEKKHVCDKINQCSDGSDEKKCQRHYLGFKSSGYDDDQNLETLGLRSSNLTTCPSGHFPCKSTGNCISIDGYCDNIFDCGMDDLTDEEQCTCRHYLVLAAPERICNSVIDCPDRADELYCGCTTAPSMFPCNAGTSKLQISSDECIQNNLVCDQHKDCSTGEDEKHCLKLSKSALRVLEDEKSSDKGYFLVRIKGLWHPYCSTDWSLDLGKRICRYLGFNGLDDLDTLDLYEFNERKTSEQGVDTGDSDGFIQIIEIQNDIHMSRLHSNYSNIINLDVEEEDEDGDGVTSCKIGYLTCN